jgi:hypothetical protein
MHGSIFVLLKRFVENSYNYSAWTKLLEDALMPEKVFEMNQIYPDANMTSILTSAVELTGIPREDLLEKFGLFLVPDLLLIYSKHIEPEWKTLDMIKYTEGIMHEAARKETQGASPPILTVTEPEPNVLLVDYYSKRMMAALAIGIIKGIAVYYKETEHIKVTNLSGLNAEQVRIKVEYVN